MKADRGIHYLYGADRLSVDRALRRLREAVHPPGSIGADLATDTIDAREAGARAGELIVQAARTLPFLTAKRLVIVRNADALDAKASEAVLHYIEAPSDTTCLILLGGEKIDGRLKLFLRLKALHALSAFDPPKNREGAMVFVNERAEELGLRFREGAMQALLEVVGFDSTQLGPALEKLAVAIPSGHVSQEGIFDALIATGTRSIFDLMNAVGRGTLGDALVCAEALDRAGEAPVKILFMLARHMRQLWMTKALVASRHDSFAIARIVGVPPFAAKELMTQSRALTRDLLERGMTRLAKADRQLKSSRVDDRILLDGLLFDLCQR